MMDGFERLLYRIKDEELDALGDIGVGVFLTWVSDTLGEDINLNKVNTPAYRPSLEIQWSRFVMEASKDTKEAYEIHFRHLEYQEGCSCSSCEEHRRERRGI